MEEKKSRFGGLRHWFSSHAAFSALEHAAKLLYEYWKVSAVSSVAVLAAVRACLRDVPLPKLAIIGLVVLLALLGLAVIILAVINWKKWTTRRQPLHTIDFDYISGAIPGSPLESGRGWAKAYKQEGRATFSADPDIPGSLRMEVSVDAFAMDYLMPHHAKDANHIEFSAKYINSSDLNIATMIFTDVEVVSSKDGNDRRMVLVKFYPGETRAKLTPGQEATVTPQRLQEMTVYLPGTVLNGDVVAFDIDFPDVINMALGSQGWVYKSVAKVQLRGSLSISPIVFSKTTPHAC